MLRPLLVERVGARCVFEEPRGLPPLYTDEAKVSQILRNFISNALKFTERGEVRVVGRRWRRTSAVTVRVADTGIGIAPEDQERIFEEFTQVENPLQRRVKGTGLGLPLCRRARDRARRRVSVESELGVGSTFFLRDSRTLREPSTTVGEPPPRTGAWTFPCSSSRTTARCSSPTRRCCATPRTSRRRPHAAPGERGASSAGARRDRPRPRPEGRGGVALARRAQAVPRAHVPVVVITSVDEERRRWRSVRTCSRGSRSIGRR